MSLTDASSEMAGVSRIAALNQRSHASIRACTGSLVAAAALAILQVDRSFAGQPEDVPRFAGVGDLPGRQFMSMALAMSGDGRVVVGYSHSQDGTEAFRWRDGAIQTFGRFPDPPVFTIAHAVSHDGACIAGSGTLHGRTQAFVFDGGALKPLQDQSNDPPISEAWGMSADGSTVVGQVHHENHWQAFLWNRGTLSIIPAPANVTSIIAQSVSADGSTVVGMAETARGAEAFIYQDQSYTGLGDLPGGTFGSAARAISADGTVVVGSATSSWGIEAFRWRSGAMIGLGALADHHDLAAYAHAVSADGSIIVGTGESEDGRDAAFIWDATHGMRSLRDVLIQECGLDLAGWWLTDATGISDDGRTITGYGKNPRKFTEGWVAHLGRNSPDSNQVAVSSTPALNVWRMTIAGLAEPISAAVAADGTVFLVESAANRISVFDKQGQLQRRIDRTDERSWRTLQSVAARQDGGLFVLDGDGRVFELDRADHVIASWGAAGDGPGQMNHPRGIAVDGDRVYIADTLNDRVLVFDLRGKCISTWGGMGQALGQFHQPHGLAVDSAGDVVVSDTGNHRIQKFDREGHALKAWGDRGNANGLFNHPEAVACARDRLFITDAGNHRIQVFNLNGEFEYVWGARALRPRDSGGRLMYPAGLAVAPNAEFAVICEPLEDRCQIVDGAAAAEMSERGANRVPPSAPPRPFIGPALEIAGHFAAILQPDRDSIDIVDLALLEPDPRVIATVGEFGTRFGQFISPAAVKIDLPRSRILVSDSGNHRLEVFEFNPAWNGATIPPPAAKFLRAIDCRTLRTRLPSADAALEVIPGDIEIDSSGRVLLLDVANNLVLHFDQQFAFSRAIGIDASGRSRLHGAMDMALGRNGAALYVVDQPADQVCAFDLDGNPLFSWGTKGTNPGEFYNPRGIAAGVDGFVYVTDGADRVQQFDEKGTFITQWGKRGIGAREFFKPRGLGQDDQGHLYIDDFGNHRVQVIGSQGEFRGAFGAALYVRPARFEQD